MHSFIHSSPAPVAPIQGASQPSSPGGGSKGESEELAAERGHLAESVAATVAPPRVKAESGEWVLSAWDVECIAVGAGVLGCGGGGSPTLGRLRLLKLLEEGKVIKVIHPERCVWAQGIVGRVLTL